MNEYQVHLCLPDRSFLLHLVSLEERSRAGVRSEIDRIGSEPREREDSREEKSRAERKKEKELEMSEKCRACSKTVYVMDQQLSLPDGATFHKSCFRCRHCNTSLHPATFSSLHGSLYCKPHFHLHLSQQNDLNKDKNSSKDAAAAAPPPPPPAATDATPAATNAAPTSENSTAPPAKITPAFTRSPSKAAMMFSGTQDKCVACSKTVYPLEKVTVEEQAYHKSCFRCSHGGCAISPSNYAALEGVLYCKHHFKQLFKEKGSYNHIMKSASIKRTAAQPQPIASAAPDA